MRRKRLVIAAVAVIAAAVSAAGAIVGSSDREASASEVAEQAVPRVVIHWPDGTTTTGGGGGTSAAAAVNAELDCQGTDPTPSFDPSFGVFVNLQITCNQTMLVINPKIALEYLPNHSVLYEEGLEYLTTRAGAVAIMPCYPGGYQSSWLILLSVAGLSGERIDIPPISGDSQFVSFGC